MVHLVDGKVSPGHKGNIAADGSYTRQPTVFDGVIAPGTDFPPEAGRYRLYVSAACGWSHRVMLARSLKGLQDVIPMTIVHPKRHDDQGWHFSRAVSEDGSLSEGQDEQFPECEPDPVANSAYLHDVYTASDPHYTGNVTVPVLLDTKTRRVVSNTSETLMRNLNSAFDGVEGQREGGDSADFYPADLREKIDEANAFVYPRVNNGVYKAGFAKSQEVYERECRAVFEALNELESRLNKTRFLCGDRLTEADLRLFATLVRFDAVYNGHFKCNLRLIAHYPNLSNYTRDVYQTPGVAETVLFSHYKAHYYWSHESINPKRRIPKGGVPNLSLPHDRKRFERQARADAGTNDAAAKTGGAKGEFVRPESKHRGWVSADPGAKFPLEGGRYHLYIANNCPWCHRAVLGRAMLGLQDVISMDVLRYKRDPERGWVFDPTVEGCGPDTAAGGITAIRDLYEREGSKEKSLPVLFDKKAQRIVSNESADILRMMETVFGPLATRKLELYPEAKRDEIDELNAWVYQEINNGAYKAGFASEQDAYEKAYDVFFNALDKCEFVLRGRPFLTGDEVTEADVRLFPTLIRFDHCYYTRFWLNKKMVRDFPNLSAWLTRMWREVPGVAEATSIDHVKRGYFGRTGNNIVPLGPDFGPDWGFGVAAGEELRLH